MREASGKVGHNSSLHPGGDAKPTARDFFWESARARGQILSNATYGSGWNICHGVNSEYLYMAFYYLSSIPGACGRLC